MIDFFEAAKNLSDQGVSFVVLTLAATRGYAPQDPGAKAIVTSDGLFFGTVGGGKIEAKALLYAQALLSRKKTEAQGENSELLTWNLQKDVGMTCGGEVTLLFEVIQSAPWKIAVFGAGHVAQAVVRTLLPLRCQITCFDPRAEWIERLPKAHASKLKAYVKNPLPEAVELLDSDTHFIVMTQGHATDVPVLKKIYDTFPDAPFIGCMGSVIKAKKMRLELKEYGVSEPRLERFRSPIGLPFGTNDPFEIAISVVAQLLELRDLESKDRALANSKA